MITKLCKKVPIRVIDFQSKMHMKRIKLQMKKLKLFIDRKRQTDLIRKSAMFNLDWYSKTYNLTKSQSLVRHYLQIGWKLGYDPSEFFSTSRYINFYPDVKQSGINPLLHYEIFGHKENRNVFKSYSQDELFIAKSKFFNLEWYKTKYDTNNLDPVLHYTYEGWKNGYNPSSHFSTCSYLKTNPDVKELNINPLLHYEKYGKIQKRLIKGFYSEDEELLAASALFDSIWYAKNYNLHEQIDPIKHYLYYGWKDLYNPSIRFSTIQYLVLNVDVQKAGINPLLHYEKIGHKENNRIYIEPLVIPEKTNELYKKNQDELIQKYPSKTEKIIIYLVPEIDFICGGVLSICSIARVTMELEKLKDHTVIVATTPSITTFLQYSKFDSGINVFRFDQLRKYFSNVKELILHIPEVYIHSFLLKIKPIDLDWLRHIPYLKINIMNQNINLMPRPSFVEFLKKITKNLTMTCAHKKYCTQQLRSAYDMPVHFFSTSNLIKYHFIPYEKKENLLVYSPDTNPFKEEVLKLISKNFPNLRLFEIQNMSYDKYLEIIGKAKWMISFGEGVDGYCLESIRSGTIPFVVKNSEFFSQDFDGYDNIYESYFSMIHNLSRDMTRYDNHFNYSSLNQRLRDMDSRLYNDLEYKENILQYYMENYTFPLDLIQINRSKRLKNCPLISIVMATFQGETFLVKQLESINNLEYLNKELIISDDGSDDKTINIIEEYSKQFPLTLLKNRNRKGHVGNFVNALKHAKGDYIALCDQDDIWLPQKLNILIERIDDFDIVQGQVIVIDENDNYNSLDYMHKAYSSDKTNIYNVEDYVIENSMLGCASLIKRECIERSLPIPKEFVYHDWWFVLNAILKGNGICNIDVPVIKYRQHGTNTAKATFESDTWCYQKIKSNEIILQHFEAQLNSKTRNLFQCDINKLKLYDIARKFAPKLAFEYFTSNSLAFTNQGMSYLIKKLGVS